MYFVSYTLYFELCVYLPNHPQRRSTQACIQAKVQLFDFLYKTWFVFVFCILCVSIQSSSKEVSTCLHADKGRYFVFFVLFFVICIFCLIFCVFLPNPTQRRSAQACMQTKVRPLIKSSWDVLWPAASGLSKRQQSLKRKIGGTHAI